MRSKLLSRDYKEELANIAESKRFGQDAQNLLLSMAYRIDDGYENYQKVKREVWTRNEFFEKIVNEVKNYCSDIIIAEPNSELEKELKENKCKILTEKEKNSKQEKVISYPNEKTLLYGISKAGSTQIPEDLQLAEKAILTAINIGKCISISESIRDFSGWSWSIIEKEIESSECNIIYNFLLFLLGYKQLENVEMQDIEKEISAKMFEEIKRVSIQFYISYDKNQNEAILKKLSDDKKKLAKMKNQAEFIIEISENKKNKLMEIKKLDELLNNPKELRQAYLNYNNKLPNEQKIFSVSHYEELLQKQRERIIQIINDYNKLQNPNEYIKIKDDLEYEIKLYEEKTDISKLQNAFLECFEKKILNTIDKKKILDLIYETRYLNFIPNCKMDLRKIEKILITKAIKCNIIGPVSNNEDLDYRILKGLFDSQAISLETLYIQLSSKNNEINVEIFDGNIPERAYNVILPEGSNIEIRKTKKIRIFE